MEAVVRNTAIQGWLSVIFVVLSIIVITTALIATYKAFRNAKAGVANTEQRGSGAAVPRLRPGRSGPHGVRA